MSMNFANFTVNQISKNNTYNDTISLEINRKKRKIEEFPKFLNLLGIETQQNGIIGRINDSKSALFASLRLRLCYKKLFDPDSEFGFRCRLPEGKFY